MVLNYPAPHGPEDAHPKYQHVFDNHTSCVESKDEDTCERYERSLFAHRDLVYNRALGGFVDENGESKE